MRKLWEKLRRIPLGGWVLIALALSAFGAGALKANSDPIRRTLLWLRPAQPGMERLAAGAQAILWRGEAVPQGFAIARNIGEARELRAEIMRAGGVLQHNFGHQFRRTIRRHGYRQSGFAHRVLRRIAVDGGR